jgi:hypothetical protein
MELSAIEANISVSLRGRIVHPQHSWIIAEAISRRCNYTCSVSFKSMCVRRDVEQTRASDGERNEENDQFRVNAIPLRIPGSFH